MSPADALPPLPAELNDPGYNAAIENIVRWTPVFSSLGERQPDGPDFLCIGAPKSGTSWLFSNLACHPTIWMPPIKDLQFFSSVHLDGFAPAATLNRLAQVAAARAFWAGSLHLDEQTRGAILDTLGWIETNDLTDSWYRGIFRNKGVDQVAGEIGHDYGILPRAGIRHALRLNPNLRVMALLRDPATRALSHARMICAAHLAPGTALRLDDLWRMVRSDDFGLLLLYSDYPRWLLPWRGLIDPNRILVDYIGRIRDQPLAVLERVCLFLGVPFDRRLFNVAEIPVLVGETIDRDSSELLAYFRHGLQRIYDEMERWMPDIAEQLRNHG